MSKAHAVFGFLAVICIIVSHSLKNGSGDAMRPQSTATYRFLGLREIHVDLTSPYHTGGSESGGGLAIIQYRYSKLE